MPEPLLILGIPGSLRRHSYNRGLLEVAGEVVPLRHKPVALMGASAGVMGTVRAQLSLRQSFLYTESYVLLKPEIYVANARDRFDPTGRLTDEGVRERIILLLDALRDWIHRIPPRLDR